MDKLNNIQALLGDGQVSTGVDDDSSPWTHYPKPRHLYEGTDSEDDEDIMREGKVKQSQSSWQPAAAGTSEHSSGNHQPTDLPNYQLQLGQLAFEGESFCPWQTVKKYPYAYIGVANRHKVAEGFFDEGKLFNQTWDFFYIHRLKPDANQTAILLVSTKQFEAFLATINRVLKTRLTLPLGGNGGCPVIFENDGTPRPRYLGRSTNREMAEHLQNSIPPKGFKVPGEPATAVAPSDRSLAAFKAKIDLILRAQKGRKVVNKEKQKNNRIAKQRSWDHSIRQIQRYLGIRQASPEKQAEIARAGLVNSGLEWGDCDAAVRASISQSANFDPAKPAPYDREGDVVFVCIDVEANERNASQITEIGVATLDTRVLKSLVPGERGGNWMSKIRARHLRINEYKHIVNSEFVSGCPDRFEFGESEFINLKDASHTVATCFKPPFSSLDENAVIDENAPKRNIILVGHGVGADISYLKSIGYNVHNLSNLQELVDTALMWQSFKRDSNPRNLGSILAELDITGWNLHNAGNDAVYTLQTMIAISIKQLFERPKRKEVREQEKTVRVEGPIKEATQNAIEKEQGWSSGGEDSDGGAPVAPVVQQAEKGSQYREGPWRTPAPGINAQNQGSDGSWPPAPAAISGNRPSTFNDLWRSAEPKSWIQGPTIPGSAPATFVPTSNLSTEENDMAKKITPAEKTWVQGPTLPGTTPTASVPTSSGRDIVDLVKGTKLFTIESKDPPPPSPNW